MNQESQYAIIKTGGKQHKVKVGQKLRVELLPNPVGEELAFNEVLMVVAGSDVKVGAPFIQGSSVKATVITHGRGDKIHIFKMRRRKNSRRHQGHRQYFTEVQITSIH